MENTTFSLAEKTLKDGTVIPDRTNEIPVRKIELTNQGTSILDADHKETVVTAKIYPENATYRDIKFKAVTLNGVQSNAVKINVNKATNTASIQAVGDGEFRLCCTCCNGLDHVEVISELEFEVTGLGDATHDPYKIVSAIDYSESSDDGLILSFQGGVYITGNDRTVVTFENIDFGDYGSDEIHLPIFSFSDVLPVEVWLGTPGFPSEKGSITEPAAPGTTCATGECLLQATYEAQELVQPLSGKCIYIKQTTQRCSDDLHRRLSGNQDVTAGLLFHKGRKSLRKTSWLRLHECYGRYVYDRWRCHPRDWKQRNRRIYQYAFYKKWVPPDHNLWTFAY